MADPKIPYVPPQHMHFWKDTFRTALELGVMELGIDDQIKIAANWADMAIEQVRLREKDKL